MFPLQVVHEYTVEHGAYPSPLHYHHFPKSVCTSINEVICHGIPDNRELQDGDIVNVDVSCFLNGVHGDLNETYAVGTVDDDSKKLMKVLIHPLPYLPSAQPNISARVHVRVTVMLLLMTCLSNLAAVCKLQYMQHMLFYRATATALRATCVSQNVGYPSPRITTLPWLRNSPIHSVVIPGLLLPDRFHSVTETTFLNKARLLTWPQAWK